MKQDQRLYSTPHYLPIAVKATPAGANGSSPGASSFEALMQQQLKRIEKAFCPVCQGKEEVEVFCPENGKDFIPCWKCGGEG